MLNKLGFALLLSLSICQFSYADNQTLFSVTSDIDKAEFKIILNADDTDSSVVNFRILQTKRAEDEDGTKDLRDDTFEVSNLKDGVPIKEEGKHKVIMLYSDDFLKDRGGHFKIDFLYNGITGRRKDIILNVLNESGTWIVYFEGTPVNNLKFIGKTIFGKLIGIKKVKVNEDSESVDYERFTVIVMND